MKTTQRHQYLRFPQAALAAFTLSTAGCALQAPAPNKADDTAVTLIGAGDIADCRNIPVAASGAARTADLIKQRLAKAGEHAYVFTAGDNAYLTGAPAEFRDCFGPTWGTFRDRTWPAPGNHEHYTPGAAGYFGYFGDRAGAGRQGYYRVDLGAWQLLVLDSAMADDRSRPADQIKATMAGQLEWLKTQLEQRKPGQCTMAVWHHPVCKQNCRGSERMLPAWKLLAEHNADLVIAGHEHIYQRFAPRNADLQQDDANGLTQMIVGTGGAELSGAKDRGSVVKSLEQFGVIELQLLPRRARWAFYGIDGPEQPLDEGEISCR